MTPAEIIAAEQLTLFLLQQGALLVEKIQAARASGKPISAQDIQDVHDRYEANKAKIDALLSADPKAPPPPGA